jgi:hypothetical protein
MPGERHGDEASSALADDTRHYHDATAGQMRRQRQRGAAALDRDLRRSTRPNPFPVWPAFFAARMTSPTKLLGCLTPRSPRRMRPGLIRISSSRRVMVRRNSTGDGAQAIEFA